MSLSISLRCRSNFRGRLGLWFIRLAWRYSGMSHP